jgi:class 3 adenylate cyclase
MMPPPAAIYGRTDLIALSVGLVARDPFKNTADRERLVAQSRAARMTNKADKESTHRRLAALLAADVVGYSRLMGSK